MVVLLRIDDVRNSWLDNTPFDLEGSNRRKLDSVRIFLFELDVLVYVLNERVFKLHTHCCRLRGKRS